MKTVQFNQMVKSLKESKTLKVKDLETCTAYQLEKIENVMLDMHLDKNLNKVLDIVTDMIVSNTKVANKKVANKKVATKEVVPVEPVEKEEPQKPAKKAPKKASKEVEEEPVGIDYNSLKLGDIVTIYNPSIIDTHTRIIYKDDNLIVTIDIEEPVTYELKKDFILDGGYVFKNKKYFLRLGK